LGRYTGDGKATVKLTGKVGMETRELVYDVSFADKTADDTTFVEDLWAGPKVGYLLDQIRINGEKKELVDEVVTLAKRYGITTPYTSYLVVPDSVPGPVAAQPAGPAGKPNVSFHFDRPRSEAPAALQKSARGFVPGAGGAGGFGDLGAKGPKGVAPTDAFKVEDF